MNDRVMGDSTTLTDVPLTVDVAGSYLSGGYAITRAMLNARFPHSAYGHCMFDTNGTRPDAEARDWETGDKEGSLLGWVLKHNAHTGKKDAVIYCNRSTIPEVRDLTGRLILGVDWHLIVATLDGSLYTAPGVIACQRDGEAQTGAHWDRSIVFHAGFFQPAGPKGKPNLVEMQKAIHVVQDNNWGPAMVRHVHSLRHISRKNPDFPFGVKVTQRTVGRRASGTWIPGDEARVKPTVRNMQQALLDMGFNPHGVDGDWGPNTELAVNAAHKAATS